MHEEEIAIIGMGCRFPGGLNDVESFWKFLIEGGDAVVEVPSDRWNIDRFYDPEPGIPGKSIAKEAGFIDGLDQFDPQFFGISPREAPYIDPQQRLLLETAWEAMEDAGIVLDQQTGTNIGVFAGVSHTDYQSIQVSASDRAGISPHSSTGNAHSIAANRISYCFNLYGPSLAMDTACSSALTAVHVACEQLRAGACDIALAGGVTVMINPDGFIGFSQAGMLSPDGRCKAFDADANGFVRGEGAGMVALKPLSKAIADNDPVYAVIAGSGTNQDGSTNGISLPSEKAQARLVIETCEKFGINPSKIGYVEAHGTGTAVGDPIEAHALAEALCQDREEPLPMGSVKTNLGHLETAAGIVSLMKAALMVNRGQIPPSLHFKTPSEHIDFEECKLRIPVEVEPFPKSDSPRMVGVNSFGFGGSNAHVILAEPPEEKEESATTSFSDRVWPLVLSARSEESLKASASNLADWLESHGKENGSSPLLPDLAYTLGARRNHHPYRLTAAGKTESELIEELRSHATDEAGASLCTSYTPLPEQPPRVGFVMSGQGPQWWGMGRQLMEAEPVFRETMEACAKAMKPHATFSLLEELGRSEEESRLQETEIGQPAIFAMQVSMAALWKSWGVEPAAIVGHSVGEIAAACVAGILPMEEAARVIVIRAREMHGCARGKGTMLAVALSEKEATDLIAKHEAENVSIAAFNGPRSLTLSGPEAELKPIADELENDEIFARFVRVDHPFHHAFMQPAADAMKAALADLDPLKEEVPFFSTVTGKRCNGNDCDAQHWANGIRQAVQFVPAVESLNNHGIDVWLEIGAHPALAISIKECLSAQDTKAPVIASARREREQASFVEAALELYRSGVTLDFKAMTPSRHLLKLPRYPWNMERWWHESDELRDGRLGSGGKGLLEMRLPRALPTWTTRIDERHLSYLRDHKVDTHIIFPAAGFVEMILEAGIELFEGNPFAVEDFEIRKPLLLSDPADGLVMELSYDPNERTFSIQSRFEPSKSWSVHVVGSLRSERVESPFAEGQWSEPDADQEQVEVSDFYEYMSDLGLKYGPEFRGARTLHAGSGKSTGVVSLSELAERRTDEYALHPVILDAALHVFSAGARTVEDRRATMKLPVRFDRILYLGSPGDESRVNARVLTCNDELIEGRIEIYDQKGEPCVLVDGFRAIAMSNAKRSGSANSGRDLVYHVDWERTEPKEEPHPLEPAPLKELHAAAAGALDDILSLRGQDRLEGVMAAQDELASAQVTNGLRNMGVKPGDSFSAESLGVAEAMLPVFKRLMEKLAARELLESDGDESWTPTDTFDAEADSAPEKLRQFFTSHPGHIPEGTLCATTGEAFGPILRGEEDAVQILFGGTGADLLEHFYGDGLLASHWMAGIAAAVKAAADRLPEGRGLRILEVGAGTGGLAAYVLPLLERNLHHYVFTDVSAGFFQPAQQKLANFSEVEFQALNLDKDFETQNLEADSFDIILGTNVLHAVSDVRVSLNRIKDLLKPGGSLVFMDVATPQLWTEAVFGLTSGWWQLTDRELRPEQPLLSRETWEKVLLEEGFDETTSIPGLHGPLGGESQVAVLARKAWQAPSPGDSDSPRKAPEESSWVIFADEEGIGEKLGENLTSVGAECQIIRRGEALDLDSDIISIRPEEPEDWKSLFSTWTGDTKPQRFVYCWAIDEKVPSGDSDALIGTDALLHLSHGLDLAYPAGDTKVDLVTRGAQSAGRENVPVNVSQGPAIGLFRVLLSEHLKISCRAVDLPFEATEEDADLLWDELVREETEREVALRGEARYVQRLSRGLSSHKKTLDPSIPLRLESKERGILDSLEFTPYLDEQPAAGEVLIEVKAAGMNFRDVLKALGLYPAETADARMYGDEVAGKVIAIGEGVDHVAVGDTVFGLAVFGLSTHTLARGADVVRLPDTISCEEASTIPVVFMTAWHALKNVARIREGETILVHAGAGGVGMAAIQIAHHFGAKVIASAGSPLKRELLKTLGVWEVIDSRSGDFAERVMELTDRRGVDIVLNALAAEAIPMGLSCLAESGRFIEIGKRDIYQNAKLPLFSLRRNASFHVIAMDAIFAGDESLTRDLMVEITELVEQRKLTPLPYRSFPANRIDAAFRLMAAGKHIGKVVVSFAEPFISRQGEKPRPDFSADPEGTYLITGGLGGFGKVLTNWLIECGARHFILTSRNGMKAAGAEEFVAELKDRDVEALVAKTDASSASDVKKLFKEIAKTKRPLKGVFHLAMVIDDAPLADLTAARMESVMGPKALGAWMLHEATREMDLDAFVMFSSISSVFGNPAQGNYSAANAFLDSLAHHRHALGLPALAVNWGVLGGDGYVARNERVAEFLARQGTQSIGPNEVVTLLESFLDANVPQAAAIRVDWAKWRQNFRSLQESPLLERIFASGIDLKESGGGNADWRAKIDAADANERDSVIVEAVQDIVGSVLRVKPETLRQDQPLTDLGLDSLMGVEIENLIESSIAVTLPPTSLMRARTIGQIATLISNHIGGDGESDGGIAKSDSETPVVEEEELDMAEIDLDSLSDEDLDLILDDSTSADEEAKADPEPASGSSVK